MKKIWILLLFVFGLTLNMAQAVGVADIETILSVSQQLEQDVIALRRLAQALQVLKDANFVVSIADGAESSALTNQQKVNLLNKYLSIKSQMQADFSLLP